ncbi:hypothetical protein MJO29_013001 [Puccinia striiformis f. sp. tritici]|uniref:hypothetical protein n=1 Tax=Puccinia striiformis f. sp. tritici TaxID=168172 RepID=UPI0020088DEE|nr:hypothetical protein Pst134EA_024447 [Puccinia striiformis f. sp. tritici]KAH9453579.1 hypothetical protein Pst134EA_024447 [Puccinia striiformis f. sp. tritici]KAI7943157.1 hypothetical protein MJO29_013001 [Puccinia striiformis f. sp. tritici]KAI9606923.1 hypothetical protein H4Q26_006467 [Puccinia striiformis f. sp. tritici PST-130]KAI9614104.1 hypothetical protein KEM48_006171 [Puccinia striiformis f. sp. tritici PST-130]
MLFSLTIICALMLYIRHKLFPDNQISQSRIRRCEADFAYLEGSYSDQEQFLAELKQLYTTALETEGNHDTQALKALLELTIEQEQSLITQKQKLTVLKQKFTVRKQKITEQQQINTCVWTLGLTLQGGQS